jgi:hypothetical protein
MFINMFLDTCKTTHSPYTQPSLAPTMVLGSHSIHQAAEGLVEGLDDEMTCH